MNTSLTTNPDHFVTSLDGQLITSSLLVAEAFGKQHKHVLEKIESLDVTDSFSSANFSAHVQKISIGNGAQRESKVYRMTKDGFMLLVMGFTGKRAMDIKIAYINAFNRMAAQLAQQTPPRLDGQITPEQQEALKQLVLTRSKSVPPEHQPRAAITLWSALKSHFGRSYKEIDANQYSEALSLVLRIPLAGDRPPADDRESVDNVMLLTDSTYRTRALDYIDDVLTCCNDFATDNGFDVKQWDPVDHQLAASGLLADLLRHTRAELSFDSFLRPVIKVLPAGTLYLSPGSDEAMRGLVSRVVSTETLMGMMSEGLARLDRERKSAK
ncbi:Rha family transcriptional regulator [Enterobacter roggenkampii]|uniref:Rha family transcriptional regulator n=1 Tax=Enterobacter roggenkampii TaxID=1812935 RepID=UPI0038909B89